MKKVILLSLSIMFLLFSGYSVGVMTVGSIGLKPNLSLCHYIIPFLLILLILCGIVLCITCFKSRRIGRFNIDIFTTIFLFFIFMLSFSVNNQLVQQLIPLKSYFSIIRELIYKLSLNGIGIYEGTLALATLCCGLTIGEDKDKKYYE